MEVSDALFFLGVLFDVGAREKVGALVQSLGVVKMASRALLVQSNGNRRRGNHQWVSGSTWYTKAWYTKVPEDPGDATPIISHPSNSQGLLKDFAFQLNSCWAGAFSRVGPWHSGEHLNSCRIFTDVALQVLTHPTGRSVVFI